MREAQVLFHYEELREQPIVNIMQEDVEAPVKVLQRIENGANRIELEEWNKRFRIRVVNTTTKENMLIMMQTVEILESKGVPRDIIVEEIGKREQAILAMLHIFWYLQEENIESTVDRILQAFQDLGLNVREILYTKGSTTGFLYINREKRKRTLAALFNTIFQPGNSVSIIPNVQYLISAKES